MFQWHQKQRNQHKTKISLSYILTSNKPWGIMPVKCDKYRIWNEFLFHTVIKKQVVCFYIPQAFGEEI